MGKIRKTYSKEYQLDVVKKYWYEGWTKREIMHPFHISSSVLHRWVTHYKEGRNSRIRRETVQDKRVT
jgi:transposase